MTIPLSEKYRPKKFHEIKGQDMAMSKIKTFLYAFSRGMAKKKAMILYGPAGTGKTALAHVLANENGCEIFELNASDLRNRKKLEEVMKPSSMQQSLFGAGKIILVDEVDGVTSTDYGGLAELINIIGKTKFPVIITANDIWQQKFSLLRQRCELVKLNEIPYFVTLDVLTNIAKMENMQVDENLLKSIAAKSRGDLRAAINDLQSVIHSEIGEVEEGDVSLREKTIDIFNALKKIFKYDTTKDTTEAYDNVDMEIDQIALWLEKNIPKEYTGLNLVNAVEALSKADVFKGRIYRQQHWRFLVYQNFLLSAGVSAAKRYKNPTEFTKYEKPTRILKIWMANQRNIQKKSIAEKYAEYTHISKKRALGDFFLIALILNDNMVRKLGLSEQEKEFLMDYRGAIKVAHGLNKFALEKQKDRLEI